MLKQKKVLDYFKAGPKKLVDPFDQKHTVAEDGITVNLGKHPEVEKKAVGRPVKKLKVPETMDESLLKKTEVFQSIVILGDPEKEILIKRVANITK
jgi:hypothetical protein